LTYDISRRRAECEYTFNGPALLYLGCFLHCMTLIYSRRQVTRIH